MTQNPEKKPILYKLGERLFKIEKDWYRGGWKVWDEDGRWIQAGPYQTKKECVEWLSDQGAVKL